ncbi:MAG: hypothetical protein ACRDAS_01310, partial [Cetobacterium sp.]
LPRLILNASKIGKINESFIHYIKNPESMTRNKIALKFEDLIETFKVIENHFKENKVYKKYEIEILKNKISHFSSFIFYPSYWNEKKYVENAEYILNFFSESKIKKNLSHLDISRRIYYGTQYYLKNKKIMYFTNKLIMKIKFILKK